MRNLLLEGQTLKDDGFSNRVGFCCFSSLGISLLSGSIRGGGGTVHVLESREMPFRSCGLSSNSRMFMYRQVVGWIWIGSNASLN